MSVLVAILGTTISPYLFFWQAAQEVEEERDLGKVTLAQRRGPTDQELRSATGDVVAGMFLSNLVMYFIILTTAATLARARHEEHRNCAASCGCAAAARRQRGVLAFHIGTNRDGHAGCPCAGGLVRYAIAESMRWRSASLGKKPHLAKKFYSVIAAAVLVGLVLDGAGFDAVKMLFWSAVLNGVLAPPLVVLVVLATSDEKVMGDRTNSRFARILGWICAGAMSAAALALLVI